MTDVIERLRRLLALQRSDNPNEAAAAAAAAQRLISKHSLDAAAVAFANDAPDEEIGQQELINFGRALDHWREQMANALCEANGCAMFIRRQAPRPGAERVVSARVVGTKNAISTVRYMLAYLTQVVGRLADEQAHNGQRWVHEFRLGCAMEVAARIREAAELERRRARQDPDRRNALVRIDSDAERLAKELAKLRIKTGRVAGFEPDSDAFLQGLEAAKTIPLGAGAGLEAPREQLEQQIGALCTCGHPRSSHQASIGWTCVHKIGPGTFCPCNTWTPHHGATP